MKRLGLLLALFAAPAAAQQAQFEPYTITAEQHQALMTYLGEVPAKYANPIIHNLSQLEAKARQKAEEEKKQKGK